MLHTNSILLFTYTQGLDPPDERDIWELLPSDVTVDDKIGYGTFGQVAKGVLSVNVATKNGP